MEDFNINKLVSKTLSKVGIPVYFASRKEVAPPLIVYNINGERTEESWDDKESVTKYKISVSLFAKGNFIEYKNKIIEAMLEEGFYRTDIPSCDYYEDIELYMQPMFFSFFKENY